MPKSDGNDDKEDDTKMPAAENCRAPLGGETRNKPSLDERTLMARALGLPGCDFEEPPFRDHGCTPNKDDVCKELKRRLVLFDIKPTKANRIKFELPSLKSAKDDLVKWLRENPIRNEKEVAMLQNLVARLRNRILAAPRPPEPRPQTLTGETGVAPKRKKGTTKKKKGKDKSTHSSDRNMKNELSSESNRKLNANENRSIVEAGSVETNANNKQNEAQANSEVVSDEENLDPGTLMARALGLPGCDFREDPFRSSPRLSNKDLLKEARRRYRIYGSKSSPLTTRVKRKGRIEWLIDNPIPEGSPEVGRLQSQVQRRREQLESGSDGSHNDMPLENSPDEPTLPVKEESLAGGGTQAQNGNEWESVDLDWEENSDNSTHFGFPNDSQSLVSSTAPTQEDAVLRNEVGAGTVAGAKGQADESETGVPEAAGQDRTSGDNDGVTVSNYSHAAARNQTADEVEALTSASLAVSTLSSESHSTPSRGEVFANVFDSSTEASSRNSNSKTMESSKSEQSPTSSASPFNGTSKPSSCTSSSQETSRLTATSTNLLRLRGGRELPSLAESRHEELAEGSGTCTKMGSRESESEGARSVGFVSNLSEADETDWKTELGTQRKNENGVEGKLTKLVRIAYEKGDIPGVVKIMAENQMAIDVQLVAIEIMLHGALSSEQRHEFVEAGAIHIILQTMKQHPSAPEVQASACGTLRVLAQDNLKHKDLIAKAGGIPIILQAIQQHQAPQVQQAGCHALGYLALHHEQNNDMIVQAGAIPIILQMMKQHPSAAEVQASACHALCVLAEGNRKHKYMISRAGAIPIILHAIEHHPSAADVQETACRALIVLAPNNLQNQDMIAGTIPLLLYAINREPSAPRVHKWACRVLVALAHNAHNSILFVQAGAIPIILHVMKHLPSAPEVQALACHVVVVLADSAHTSTLIVQAGAIPIILHAMKQHPAAPEVQQAGCLTLSYLAIDHNPNRDTIVEAGGIRIILEALKLHPSAPEVQEWACHALVVLAKDNIQNQDMIAQADATPFIIHAIKDHLSAREVQKWNFVALGPGRYQKHNMIVQAGAILQTMKQHPSAPEVQAWACQALVVLAQNAHNSKLFLQAGAIPIVLHAMKQHPPAPQVQPAGCRAPSNLAIDHDQNQDMIAEADGIRIILEAMKQHPAAREVQEWACHALVVLIEDNLQYNQDMIAQAAGAIPIILYAMIQHPSAPEVQVSACQALVVLAYNAHNSKLVVQEGAIPIVLQAMQRHSSAPEVQKYCCALMSLLARGHFIANGWNNKSFIAPDAIALIIDAIRFHHSVPFILEYACSSLFFLSLNDSSYFQVILQFWWENLHLLGLWLSLVKKVGWRAGLACMVISWEVCKPGLTMFKNAALRLILGHAGLTLLFTIRLFILLRF